MHSRLVQFLIPIILVVSGCSGPSERPAATPSPESQKPAIATTPSAARIPTEPVSLPALAADPSPSPRPIPTQTPRTHTVKAGQDLGGLAFNYGLSVADILAANPGIDPGLLTVGQTLVIPASQEDANVGGSGLPMPVEILLDPPVCLPQADGGAWCFVTVSNPYDAAVESVSVRIGLPGADGEPRQSQDVPALLNVLPASSRFPLAAYFSPPLPDGYQPSVELLTALPVSDGSRYLSVRLQDLRTTIQPDGLGAQVDGKAWLDEAVDEGAVLWLGVAAYDRQERPLGIRKLEITAPPGNARGFPFKGTVYSAGGEIHRVDVLAEARR